MVKLPSLITYIFKLGSFHQEWRSVTGLSWKPLFQNKSWRLLSGILNMTALQSRRHWKIFLPHHLWANCPFLPCRPTQHNLPQVLIWVRTSSTVLIIIHLPLSGDGLHELTVYIIAATPAAETRQDSLVRGASEAFVKSAAKQGGKEAAKYEQEHGQEQLQDAQQQLDNAKAQAQVSTAKPSKFYFVRHQRGLSLFDFDQGDILFTWVLIDNCNCRACGRSIVDACLEPYEMIGPEVLEGNFWFYLIGLWLGHIYTIHTIILMSDVWIPCWLRYQANFFSQTTRYRQHILGVSLFFSLTWGAYYVIRHIARV